MIALLLAVTATVSDPTGPDAVRYSNVRFDAGHNWTVAERSPRMVLKPTDATFREQARITIEPATPFGGTIDAGLDAAWAKALAGKATREAPERNDAREIEAGGAVASMSAPITPAGGLFVVAVKAGSKLTVLTLEADTDLAHTIAMTLFLPVLMSLEVVPDEVPPPGATPGTLTPGPDPSDAFDWDGPDEFRYGIYDHDCLRPNDEYAELRRTASGFVGAVKPRDVRYDDALKTLKKLLDVPAARAQYDAANGFASKEHPRLYTAGAATRALQGDPFGAMAQLLAGVDAVPDDPDVLFSLASVTAEAGMPNESLAVLGRLKATGKAPAMAMGLSADAAIAYLAGYDEMLRGHLEEAKQELQQAIRREPFLNEARRVLSLIQAHQGAGAAGAATYLDGMWRFTPRKHVLCGGNQDDSQRPGVDEMFDTSKGVPGKLAEFRHPRSADDLPKFKATMDALGLSYASFVHAQGQREIQLGASLPQGHGRGATPYDAWAEKMSTLIEGLDESEPLILKLQADADASEKDALEAMGRAGLKLGRKVTALAAASGANVDICPEVKSYVTQALAEARPYIVHWDTMQRRYAKTWYRMATGLNAHIGNAKWHAFNDASLRTTLAGHSAALISSMTTAYGATVAPAGTIYLACAGADGDAGGAYAEPEEGPTCPDGMRNMAFKYAFEVPGVKHGHSPKLGVQADCDKFTVDIEYDLLGVDGALAEFGLGGFAQVEMYRNGEWSLFMGPRAGGSIGGSGGTLKDGIWVKAAADGTITELGGKIAAESTMRLPGGESISAPVDEMVFNLLPEPPKPVRGPRLKAFRGAIP